jgi:hypothetical protein
MAAVSMKRFPLSNLTVSKSRASIGAKQLATSAMWLSRPGDGV